MARVSMRRNSTNEVDGSSSGIVCSWTDPLLRVSAASGWLLICHRSRDVDEDAVYYPERAVVRDKTRILKNENKSLKKRRHLKGHLEVVLKKWWSEASDHEELLEGRRQELLDELHWSSSPKAVQVQYLSLTFFCACIYIVMRLQQHRVFFC